jgi:hypothetical protein
VLARQSRIARTKPIGPGDIRPISQTHEPVFWLRTLSGAFPFRPTRNSGVMPTRQLGVLYSGASATDFHRLPVRPDACRAGLTAARGSLGMLPREAINTTREFCACEFSFNPLRTLLLSGVT